jgi:SAM-dependent methyltransferase
VASLRAAVSDTKLQAASTACEPTGLLGDTAGRDYSHKLRLFNRFAESELRRALTTLRLTPGMRILDAGCGTGEMLGWLCDEIRDQGEVIGIDLASAHVTAARAWVAQRALVLQADLARMPLGRASLDLVWCVNTVNHLRSPQHGVDTLASLLRAGGRLALGQSSLLPDMYFAWDARLERVTNEAVRHYYRDRYGLSEYDLTSVRCLVGLLRHARLRNVVAHTFLIERVSPVSEADEAYLLEAIFRNTWGARLKPYLSIADYAQLARLCDPQDPQFALRRPDFHFLQSFTLVVGEI